MFEEAKKLQLFIDNKWVNPIEISGDSLPTKVKFNVNKMDYKLDYEPLNNDYTAGVLAKREYDVTLKFDEKSKDYNSKEEMIYTMIFNVELKKVTPEMIEKAKANKKSDDESDDNSDDDDEKDSEHLKGAF
jgi:hypothetical protein